MIVEMMDNNLERIEFTVWRGNFLVTLDLYCNKRQLYEVFLQTLILADDATGYRDLIATNLADCNPMVAQDVASAEPYLEQSTVVLGAPGLLVRVLDRMPNLQWCQSTWAGVRELIAHPRRDYLLTGVKGVFGSSMSEYVMAWILALAQNIPERISQREWNAMPARPLSGKSLGILGTGSIAQAVARSATAMGLKVSGLNTDGRPVEGFNECFARDAKQAFAAGLDYLLILLPDTPQTSDFADRTLLDALNPGAVLINAGRGNSIVDADLLQALRGGGA